MTVHITAIISVTAKIGTNVIIDAYCIVEDGVVLGDGVHLHAHSIIKTGATIGNRTVVHSFSVLGDSPQDITYKGEDTTLEIGDDCIIREGVIIHKGSTKENLATKIGNSCFVMCNAHIGHDCKIGNSVVIGPNSVIGGHCHIFDGVNISGLVAVHHFVRIGNNAMIGGGGIIVRDIVPFGLTDKNGCIMGANIIGLKRSGIDKTSLKIIVQIFKNIQNSEQPFNEIIAGLSAETNSYIKNVYDFLSTHSNRGIQRGLTNG